MATKNGTQEQATDVVALLNGLEWKELGMNTEYVQVGNMVIVRCPDTTADFGESTSGKTRTVGNGSKTFPDGLRVQLNVNRYPERRK